MNGAGQVCLRPGFKLPVQQTIDAIFFYCLRLNTDGLEPFITHGGNSFYV